MIYSDIALDAVLVAVLLDLFILRSQMITRDVLPEPNYRPKSRRGSHRGSALWIFDDCSDALIVGVLLP